MKVDIEKKLQQLNEQDGWDNQAKVEAEFPLSEWEHISVKSPDEARYLIAMRTINSPAVVYGNCYWYGDNRGVVVLKKEATVSKQHDEIAPIPTKKRWWRFWK